MRQPIGIIYSAGMSCNSFDVAPEHGRTPFYVDAKHDGDNIDSKNPTLNELTGLYYLWKNEHDVGYKVYNGRIIVYSEKPKDSGY